MKSFFQLREEATQVTVGDYTTKHFDMCPSAVKLYSKIKGMTPMVHLIVENMMLQDLFFRLEKQAVAQGTIDEDDYEKASDYAEMIMDNADQMGLEDEHAYIYDVHMAKFEQLAGMEDEEEDDEEDMNEKTLTPAEIKKRKEVADAIKRDNPNMPMAKKMAIATATAKKVAEEAEQIDELSKKTLGQYIKVAGHDREQRQKKATGLSQVGHDIKSQNRKQADDLFHRAGAELHKAANRKAGINKAVNKLVGEEVEQIDELSKKTLGSYVKKASADRSWNSFSRGHLAGMEADHDAKKMIKKDQKRMFGINRATDKLAKEEVELDEVSKSTLGRYVKAASTDAAHKTSEKDSVDRDYPTSSFLARLQHKKELGKKLNKRRVGISKAVDRLTKEEVEQIDELKKSTLASYVKKSADDLTHIQRDITSGSTKDPEYKDLSRMRKNRKAGISRAVNTLAKEEVEQVDEISRDLARRYIRKVADKTNTGELSTKEVEKRRPGVHLAGKKAYPGIAGKARVTATEEVEKVDEVSVMRLGQYTTKAAQQGSKRVAGQWMADQKLRKRDGYSSSAKVAATSTPKKD